MVDESEKNKAKDHERRERIESRNKADGIMYDIEKNLNEHKVWCCLYLSFKTRA